MGYAWRGQCFNSASDATNQIVNDYPRYLPTGEAVYATSYPGTAAPCTVSGQYHAKCANVRELSTAWATPQYVDIPLLVCSSSGIFDMGTVGLLPFVVVGLWALGLIGGLKR